MGRITVLLGLGAGIKPSSSEFSAGGGFRRTLYPQPAATASYGPSAPRITPNQISSPWKALGILTLPGEGTVSSERSPLEGASRT